MSKVSACTLDHEQQNILLSEERVEALQKVNVLGLDRQALELFFVKLGEKPYRAQQLLQWIHFYGETDFEKMTNLSKALRQKLMEQAEISLPEIAYESEASDGTRKWLLRFPDGNAIETVFIPEKNRGTLCISSQVGCALNCDFCSTGKQGFNRNLLAAEIIGQLWRVVRSLSQQEGIHDRAVTNVVMMGMGEPLLNVQQVIPALRLMLDDFAYGLSSRRVTVSTAGIVPAMYQLRKELDVALAVSLHAPNDELRNILVPLNKKYPLSVLMPACQDYFKQDKRRSVVMEYVMLDGVNDSVSHADQLVKLLSQFRVKVNLIPFNPFPHTHYRRSSAEAIMKFQAILQQAGVITTVRRTRGEDDNAACGQLVGKVQDRTRRHQQFLQAIKEHSQ